MACWSSELLFRKVKFCEHARLSLSHKWPWPRADRDGENLEMTLKHDIIVYLVWGIYFQIQQKNVLKVAKIYWHSIFLLFHHKCSLGQVRIKGPYIGSFDFWTKLILKIYNENKLPIFHVFLCRMFLTEPIF